MFGNRILIVFLLFITVLPLYAQKAVRDSVPEHNEQKNDKEVHSPKKASIYSAVLPGLGQAYNKKYWKIPVIYVGFGVIIYFIDYNNGWYTLLKDAYLDLSDQTNFNAEIYIAKYEKLPFLATVDYESSVDRKSTLDYLSRYQESYRRNRDLLIIGTAVFYALNIIDASVDAHLYDFDISDDLTFKWRPGITTIDNQKFLCFNCSINF